jgi:class 3 adenylate cyclase/pimeloyl-ACP methyl ester carboxylesterase
MPVETRYTKSGDVHVAYQVSGGGPLDLIWIPGFVSHLEVDWTSPVKQRIYERLGRFCRLIRFDKRGTGLSDRGAAIPSLEERMDDVRAVMDAVGSKQAALLGVSEGGPLSILFAATYPERTLSLSIYGSYARRLWASDHPYGRTAADWEGVLQRLEREWGGPVAMDIFAPSVADDPQAQAAWANYLRQAASPGAALAIMRMNGEIDVRHVLPAVRVPTLIVHRKGDRLTYIEQARYLATHVAGARLVELEGDNHIPWFGDTDALFGAIIDFLSASTQAPEPDRQLATVLFTDIVGATEKAAAVGDSEWRRLLERHHALVRRELVRFRGREVDTAGDGFLASFDGPARAVRCAQAIQSAVRDTLELDLRAGLHTGECEVMDGKLAGLAVHIGARVAALAGPGEVLVSNTVKDLVAGSGLDFAERGQHVLKGVPGRWQLYSAAPAG